MAADQGRWTDEADREKRMITEAAREERSLGAGT